MSLTLRIIIDFFLVFGTFFCLAGVVGMLRMPDPLCRIQSSTNIATLGIIGFTAAGLVYAIFVEHNIAMAFRAGLLSVFILMTNPIGSHAISKAAYLRDRHLADDMVCDQYGRDMEDE